MRTPLCDSTSTTCPSPARTGKVIIRAGEGHDGGKPCTVPANAELCRTLAAYKQARRDLPGADTCPALMLNRYGQRLSVRAIEKMLASLGASIGLPDLVPYVLRHTSATDMLRAGATSALVSELLGHASRTTTWTYTNADRARIVGDRADEDGEGRRPAKLNDREGE